MVWPEEAPGEDRITGKQSPSQLSLHYKEFIAENQTTVNISINSLFIFSFLSHYHNFHIIASMLTATFPLHSVHNLLLLLLHAHPHMKTEKKRQHLNYHCAPQCAGLPSHMMGEVSWDPKKKMIVGLIVFNPLWQKICSVTVTIQ